MRTLIVIATYTIGKEKVLLEVSRILRCKICVTTEKWEILKLLNLEYMDIFTTDPRASHVQVVSWNKIGEMAAGGQSLFLGFLHSWPV